MKFQRLLVASLLSLPASGFAASSSATATLQVSASVEQSCSVTANPLNFGSYDPQAATANDVQGSLKVTCTKDTPYTITMNYGVNHIAGVRTMKSSTTTSSLYYEIYKDSDRTAPWGNSKIGGQTGTGTGLEQSIPLHGRIEKNRWVAAGNYSDSVTVTLSLDGID